MIKLRGNTTEVKRNLFGFSFPNFLRILQWENFWDCGPLKSNAIFQKINWTETQELTKYLFNSKYIQKTPEKEASERFNWKQKPLGNKK